MELLEIICLRNVIAFRKYNEHAQSFWNNQNIDQFKGETIQKRRVSKCYVLVATQIYQGK